jgi:hypothetical protein
MPTHDASGGAQNAWHLSGTVGAVTLDTYFIVPASYSWQEHIDASAFVDPCTQAKTIMVTSDGNPGKLFGRPTQSCYGSNGKAAKDDLRRAWELGGPWTLTTPTESLTVYADPSAQDFDAVNFGDRWDVSFTWQEN